MVLNAGVILDPTPPLNGIPFGSAPELKRHHCEWIKSSLAGQRHILHPDKDPHTLDTQTRSSKAVETL